MSANQRERLPAYQYVNPQSKAILDTLDDADAEDAALTEDVLAQLFIGTATWSLPLWERKYGLPGDTALSTEERRSAVKSRMIASGPTSKNTVQEIATSLTGYKTRVTENFGDYSFSLEFLADSPGFADIDVTRLRDTIERIQPAHLRFIINGITWNDMQSLALTWNYFADDPTTWAGFEAKFPLHKR